MRRNACAQNLTLVIEMHNTDTYYTIFFCPALGTVLEHAPNTMGDGVDGNGIGNYQLFHFHFQGKIGMQVV